MTVEVPPPADILAQLRMIRRRRRLKHWPFFTVLLLMICLFALRSVVPSFNGSVWESALTIVIALGLIPAVIFGFVSVLHLRCPRCHDFFHSSANPRHNEFAQSCMHCGLRLDGRNAAMGSNSSQEGSQRG